MGTFYAPDPQTGLAQGFKIKGNAPSPTEQQRIDTWLAGRKPVAPPVTEPVDDGTALGRGFGSGLAMMQEFGGSSVEGAAGAAGLEGLAQWGTGVREAGEARQEGIQRLPRGDVDTVGEGLSYVGELVGEQAPIIGTTMAGALTGAGIGSLGGPVGSVVGGLLGGAAASLPLLYGGNREEQRDTRGEIDESTAFLWSLPQAAMEAVGAGIAAKGFRVIKAGDGLLTKAAKGAGEGAAGEVPTEIGQEVIQIYQAGGDITSPEAIDRYIDAGIAAGILGGGIGGVSGVVRGDSKSDLEEDLAREEAEGNQRIANAQVAAEQEARRGGGRLAFERTAADDAAEPEFRSTRPVEGLTFSSERAPARFESTRREQPEFRSVRQQPEPEPELVPEFSSRRGMDFKSSRERVEEIEPRPLFTTSRKADFKTVREYPNYFERQAEFTSPRTMGEFSSERVNRGEFKTTRQSQTPNLAPVINFRDAVDRPTLAEAMRKELDAKGLKDVGFKLAGVIGNDPTIAGQQEVDADGRGLISMATDIWKPGLSDDQLAKNMAPVLSHEMIHALRQLDLFSSPELSSLEKASKAQKRMRDGKKRNYSYYDYEKAKADKLGYGDDKQRIAEEAIAEMYRDHAAGQLKLSGKPRSLWQKILKAIKAIGTAGRSLNISRAADVFERIDSGEIGGRERGVQRAGDRSGSRQSQSPTEREKAFNLTADTQRDEPERRMLDVQFANGGGVMNAAVEHIGDLTHRMAERGGVYGREFVEPKVRRMLNLLTNGYGFEREHNENIKNNAAARDISEDKQRRKVNTALRKYADAHRTVPVWNELQDAARQAAISLGVMDIPQSVRSLRKLQSALDDGSYETRAMEYDPNYENKPSARQSRALSMFHSPLLKGVTEAKQKAAKAKDWKAIISKMPGVKKAEIDWLGVNDWLDSHGPETITRDDLAGFIADHQITIHEDVGGGEEAEISVGEVQSMDPPDDWIESEEEYQANFYRTEYPEWDEEQVEEAAREAAYESWYDQDDPPGTVNIFVNGYPEDTIDYSGGEYTLPDGTTVRDEDDVVDWFRANMKHGDFDFAARHIDYIEPDGENYREILLRMPNLHQEGPNKIADADLTEVERIQAQMDALVPEGMRPAELDEPEYREWTRLQNARNLARASDVARRRESSPSKPFILSGHFDQPNIVVHARVTDRNTAGGQKVLFVEEVQSDLTSMHREMRTKEQQEAFETAQSFSNTANSIVDMMMEGMRLPKGGEAAAFSSLRGMMRGAPAEAMHYGGTIKQQIDNSEYLQGLMARGVEATQKYDEAMERAGGDGLGSYRPEVPDTPFKGELPYSLMMKRLIREAVEGGYTKLAWTPSEMQADRWSGEYGDGYKIAYDQYIKKAVEKATKKYGGKVRREYGVVPGKYFNSDFDRNKWLAENNITIADVVQRMKDNYSSVILMKIDESGGPEKVLLNAAENLTGGGIQNKEDMVREFLSRSEANFDRLFPEAAQRPVWSVEITDAMRDSVNETMAMFSRSLSSEPLTSRAPANSSVPSLRNSASPQSVQAVENAKGIVQYGRTREVINKGLGLIFSPTKADELSNYFFTKLQDSFLPVGEIIDEVRKRGGNVLDAMDTYMKESLSHGIIGEETRANEEKLYTPAITQLNALEISSDEEAQLLRISQYMKNRQARDKANSTIRDKIVGSRHNLALQVGDAYLYALHAKERNKYFRDKDPSITDGSGISDQEADAILNWVDQLDLGNKSSLERFAADVRAIVKDTNDRRKAAGLIREGMPDLFENWVPLRGNLDPKTGELAEDTRLQPVRLGGVRGKEDPKMTGRHTEAAISLLENVITHNAGTIQRAARNDVIKSFAKLVDAEGDVLKDMGQTIYRSPAPDNQNDQRYVGFKEDGQQKYLYINDRRIARAFETTLNPSSLGAVAKAMAKFNRYLANINTQYNPEFMFPNFMRDIQFAMVTSDQYGIEDMKRRIISGQRNAWGALNDFHRKGKGRDDGQAPDYTNALKDVDEAERDRRYREFRKFGAKNGLNQLGDLEEVNNLARRVLKNVSDKGTSGRDAFAHFLSKDNSLLKFLENMNEIMENASRFAFYSAARESGLSPDRAALAARNLTTNFSKAGENKAFLNAMYLFYNASLQGSMALINAGMRSKKVQKGLASTVAMGALMDMALASFGEEDDDGIPLYDKLPTYVLEHNWILPNPLGGYITIPMPYGLNTFYNTGRATSRFLRGGYSPDEYRDTVLGTGLEILNPLGDDQSLLAALAPTIADPFIDLAANENYAGDPIYPEPFPGDPGTALSYQYWNSTSPTLVKSAKWLNDVTGGTPIEPGWIDWQPDKLEYWIDYLTGGAGKFALRTLEAPATVGIPALQGDFEEEFTRHIPMVRRFQYTPSDRENIAQFITKFNKVRLAREELKDAVDVGDRQRIDRARDKYSPELKIYGAVNSIYNSRRKVLTLRDSVMSNDNLSDERKKQILDKLDEQEQKLVDRANKLMKDIK